MGEMDKILPHKATQLQAVRCVDICDVFCSEQSLQSEEYEVETVLAQVVSLSIRFPCTSSGPKCTRSGPHLTAEYIIMIDERGSSATSVVRDVGCFNIFTGFMLLNSNVLGYQLLLIYATCT